MSLPKTNLPIYEHKERIIQTVKESPCVVIIGETGSGKTTQLPQYLLEAGLFPLAITQPRRVAAISAAQRVADELGTICGVDGDVGYRVRFENEASSSSKVVYLTDGCLLRECLDDPYLSRYAVVVLDEAHVRSLDTDILFGLLKRMLVNPAPENVRIPKLIIMSATLQSEKFTEFFQCPAIHIPGREYPVKVIHCDLIHTDDERSALSYAAKAVDVVMDIHLHEAQGDVLVFLTGQAEIEKVCDQLFALSEKIDYRYDCADHAVEGMAILPVYGSMTTEAQRQIFEPAEPGIRKVVVSTEIASTSLTIDGIVYVVDSGFVKQLAYNPHTGLESLQVVPISKSESKQRTGRAGRTRPGECFRLYSADFEKKMDEFTLPEIQRTSLVSVVLTLKSLGIHNVMDFHYLDRPDDLMLLEALKQLYFFDALDRTGNITAIGRQMINFPLPPNLSRVLLYSPTLNCQDELLDIVAMLSVENIYIKPVGVKAVQLADKVKTKMFDNGGDDFNALLYIYRSFHDSAHPRQWCHDHFLHFRALATARKVRDQLAGIMAKMSYSTLQEIVAEDRKRKAIADEANENAKRKKGETAESDGESSSDDSDYFMQLQHKQKHRHSFDTGRSHWRSSSSSSRHELAPIKQEIRELVRRCLCYGLFNNSARQVMAHSFRTMDGHGTGVMIHPSSCLFGKGENLSWIIFHEIVLTSKVFARTVSGVNYSWVKDLLPKIHEVDVWMLSGTGEVRSGMTVAHFRAIEQLPAPPVVQEIDFQRRNTDDKVAEARERALQRKQAKALVTKK